MFRDPVGAGGVLGVRGRRPNYGCVEVCIWW